MRLLILFRLALRNLRRQARRSLLTGFAMVLGVGLLVLSRSLAEGAHEDWIDSGVRLGSGHVAVQAPEFRVRRTLEHRLGADALSAALAALDDPAVGGHVSRSVVRLEVQGLASSAAGAVPVSVVGVDPEPERGFSELDRRVAEGRYLEPDDRLAAYIGERLAQRLELDIGSRLVLTAQDADGDISGQLVRVVGVFRTGLPEVDERYVQVPLETAREWLETPREATSVALLLRSSRSVEPVVETLTNRLESARGEARVLGWREAMPALDAAVKADDFGDWVFHAITLVIVALAVVNTILMSVLNRTREFGVVRALGMTRRETGAQVFIEGVLISAVSGLVGIVVGLGVTWLFFRNGLDYSGLLEEGFRAAGIVIEPVIYPRFHVTQIVWSLAFVFGIGVTASLYPALRATKIDVAEAMKFEA